MKDSDIINLYWEREEKAIAATAEKYGSYCYSIAYNILYNHEDAEECVNNTYLGAWDSMPPHRPDCLSVWLGKITRNISLNRYKQYHTKKRGCGQAELVLTELEECIPSQENVEQVVDEMVFVEAINRFLYAQPEQKRNIFIRRYWYLSPIRDIAKVYGMSESKAASLLFRMRNKLKAYLEKEEILL